MPNEGLINELVTKEAEEQVKRITGLLKENVDALNSNVELAKAFEKAFRNSTNTSEVKKGIENLRKSNEDFSKSEKEVIALAYKKIELEKEISRQIAMQKAENKALLETQNKAAAVAATERNSLERAQKLILNYTDQKKKLNLATEEGRRINENFNKAIQRQVDFINKNADVETKRNKNVGNYKDALQTLESELASITQKMSDMDKSGKGNSAVYETLSIKASALETVIKATSTQYLNVKQEVKGLTESLINLEKNGLSNTEAYRKLQKELGKTKDTVADLQARLKYEASDSKYIDGVIGAAQTLTGVFGIAEGAATLFGDSNEELQKSMQKLQAVMVVLQGLQALQNAMQQESAMMMFLTDIRTKAVTISTTIWTAVQRAATVATATLGATISSALIATGLGALLVLLPMVVSGMSSMNDSTDDATDSMKDQAKEMDDLNQKYKEQIELSERLTNSKKGGLDDMNRELKLLESKGATEQELFVKREQILQKELRMLSARNYTYIKGTKDQMDAEKEMLDKKNEIEGLRLSFFKKQNDERIAKEKELAEKQKDIAEKARQKAIEDKRKRDELAKAEYENKYNLLKTELNISAENNKSILDNETLTLEERLIANNNFYKDKIALSILDKSHEEKLVEGSKTKLAEIDKRYSDIQNKLIAEANKSKSDLIQKNTDKEVKAELEKLDKLKEQYDNYSLEALRQLDEEYAKGLISTENYEKQRYYISQNANQNSLLAQLDYAQSLLNDERITGEKRVELERQISKLKNDIAKGSADIHKDTEVTNLQTFNNFYKKYEQYQKGIADLTLSITEILIDAANRQAEAKLKHIDEFENAEKESLNRRTMSDKQREEELKKIELEASARRKTANDERIKQLRKYAAVQKAVDIANVISGTASAVVNALGAKPFTPLNIAMAVGVGLSGAAQLAKAIATPLPQYKYGTKDHPGGPAVVGDGGVSEFVVEPSGKKWITPNTSTIVDLPRHSVVMPKVPHDLLMKDLVSATIINLGNAKNVDSDIYGKMMVETYERGTQRIEKAIRDSKTNVSIYSSHEHYILNKELNN